jgi:hypothetical protein
LHVPCQNPKGRFSFFCPLCKGFTTGVHHKTNLARCFDCEKNFNPIDLVMMVRQSDFVNSVHFLKKLHAQMPAAVDHPHDAGTGRPSSGSAKHIGLILDGIMKSVNENISKHPPANAPSPSDDSELSDRILRLEQKMGALKLQVDRLVNAINRLLPSA